MPSSTPTTQTGTLNIATGEITLPESNEAIAERVAADVAKALTPSKKPNGVKTVSAKPAAPKRTAAQVRKDAAAAKAERRPVTVNGVTVQVSKKLSNAEALVFARKAIAAGEGVKAAKATRGKVITSEVERTAAPAKPKGKRNTGPKVQTKPSGKVAIAQNGVPAGSLRVRFSKTAYEQAIAGKSGAEFRKANPSIAKATKGLTGKSAGSSIAYFAVMTLADVDKTVAHLRATAKAWTAMGKDAPGMSKPLLDNADRTAADAKGAAKK